VSSLDHPSQLLVPIKAPEPQKQLGGMRAFLVNDDVRGGGVVGVVVVVVGGGGSVGVVFSIRFHYV
jgi:hypothetical protein